MFSNSKQPPSYLPKPHQKSELSHSSIPLTHQTWGGGRRKNDHTNIFTGSLFHTDAMRWANEVTKHTQANPLPKMANMRRPYLPGSKIVSAPFSKQKWPHLHTERMLILRGLGFINRNEEAAENSKGSTVRKGMTK